MKKTSKPPYQFNEDQIKFLPALFILADIDDESALEMCFKLIKEQSAKDAAAMLLNLVKMAKVLERNMRQRAESMLVNVGGLTPDYAARLNMPEWSGAFHGYRLATRSQQDQKAMCEGCAFRLGSIANTCLATTWDANLCAEGTQSQPFYCHENLDESGNPTKKMCWLHKTEKGHKSI